MRVRAPYLSGSLCPIWEITCPICSVVCGESWNSAHSAVEGELESVAIMVAVERKAGLSISTAEKNNGHLTCGEVPVVGHR